MATDTVRLKYELDPAGIIGVNHKNWDRADFAAGILQQKSDDQVPSDKLFNGATCAESDSNKVVRKFWNGNGFNTRPVNYPFQYRAEFNTSPGNGTPGPWGWGSIRYDSLVNAGNGNREDGTNAFIPPISAVFLLRMHFRWGNEQNGDRTVGYYLNGALQDGYTDIRLASSTGAYTLGQQIEVALKLSPSDRIRPYFYNNGGGATTLFGGLEVTLLNPVY